jgi:hypothetical protein
VINHITYHLSPEGLGAVGDIMSFLGFHELKPDDPFEHGYDVRWFQQTGSPTLHFVADGGHGDVLHLGHVCLVVSCRRFQLAKASTWLARDSGSGRIWLQHDALRIELRKMS